MWHLPIPSYSSDETLDTCIASVRDADLKTRLSGAAFDVAVADYTYRSDGPVNGFNRLDPAAFAVPGLTAAEMGRVYDGRLAANNSAGRHIYDAIRRGSRKGRCPLCTHRPVMTLDHHLPKSRYPALAVNPANLIPACSDCNKQKAASTEDTLHPYYDNVETDLWLHAAVVERAPAAVRYGAVPPPEWPTELRRRTIQHFKVFKLGFLYSAQAAHTLSGIRGRLARLASEGGEVAVRNHLLEEWESWRLMDQNSWEAALYDALSSSIWFCAEGYKM